MSSDPRPLALLGLRGSGKSTVGKLLAARQGWAFVDLDEALVRFARRAGRPVGGTGDLLERAGRAVFRDLESATLRQVLEPSPAVVLATGGGVVERADNRALLARAARCVFLSVPLERLAQRLRVDPTPRPALLGPDRVAEIAALARFRTPLYLELAEIVLECGARSPAELVEELWSRLG
jgi:shikimate kinase